MLRWLFRKTQAEEELDAELRSYIDHAVDGKIASGLTPDFDPSPARFTCSSAGTSSRRAAESESSECTSSQIRFTTLTLFDCR